jgi:broad specificity phosphatase PhoE
MNGTPDPVEDSDGPGGCSVRRLLLVRHAPTAATRTFAFPADEPIDDRGREAAADLGSVLPTALAVVSSPSLRCRQTAAAAGLAGLAIEPLLRECDFGAWAGRTLEELSRTDAEGVRAWMTEPDADPHDGESLAAFAMRVGQWLDHQAEQDGGVVAITHGGVIKAAVVHALGAPIEAFWRIDAAPLAITELHAHDGRWTLTRSNARPTAVAA